MTDTFSSIKAVYIKYDSLVKEFTIEKLEKRFASLLTASTEFIDKMGYAESAKVDEIELLCAMLDYFSDISRLKAFHNITHIHETKVISYEAYWLLKRKPIQVIKNDVNLLYINEKFVLSRIIHCICQDNNESVLTLDNEKLSFFTDTLFYFLKYRSLDAQTIELLILSFNAGVIFANEIKGIENTVDN